MNDHLRRYGPAGLALGCIATLTHADAHPDPHADATPTPTPTPAGAFPDAATTGVPAGVTLEPDTRPCIFRESNGSSAEINGKDVRA